MKTSEKLYGWYDSPDQPMDKPAYDPPVICLICVKPIEDGNCRTYSIMGLKQARSYFYRVHKTCDSVLSEKDRLDLESSIIDNEI